MTARIKLWPVIATLFITACTSPILDNGKPLTVVSSAEENFTVTLESFDRAVDLAGKSSKKIGSKAVNAIEAFLISNDARYGDYISVRRGQRVSDDLVKATVKLIMANGLQVAEVVPALDREAPVSGVSIEIIRLHAVIPECNSFRPISNPRNKLTRSEYLGCSNDASLAMMVANPGDLINGQEDKPWTVQASGAIKQAIDRAMGNIDRPQPLTLSFEGLSELTSNK